MKRLLNVALIALLSVAFVGCANNEQAGTLTGAVAGGLLGSRFGGGSGQLLMATGGAIAGALIGNAVGKSMDRNDYRQMNTALEDTPTGKSVNWKNPDTNVRYRMTPTKTYFRGTEPCREFQTHAWIGGKQREVYGKACRMEDGSWKIMS